MRTGEIVSTPRGPANWGASKGARRLRIQGGIMRTTNRIRAITCGTILTLLIVGSAGRADAKERNSPSNPNDPTYRLFSLLDSKFNGKIEDFCVLADLISDPQNPGQQLQRVICLDYSKDRAFGKLNIHVRTVAPLTPDQLKTYTPKQTFDFAETDTSKYTKSDAGSFGRPGDVYFQAAPDGGPLTSASATSDVQTQYELLINQYIMPALEKKATDGSGT